MSQSTDTETVTAGDMGRTAEALGRQLDYLGVIPISITIAAAHITFHVRGADLDAVADNYWAGQPKRYSNNVERRGKFAEIPVEVFANAAEYDAAKNCCKACGQTVPAVSQ